MENSKTNKRREKAGFRVAGRSLPAMKGKRDSDGGRKKHDGAHCLKCQISVGKGYKGRGKGHQKKK